jgi:hypothetical protein
VVITSNTPSPSGGPSEPPAARPSRGSRHPINIIKPRQSLNHRAEARWISQCKALTARKRVIKRVRRSE